MLGVLSPPEIPFNPLVSDTGLDRIALAAGPMGLLIYAFFVPMTRWLGARRKHVAIIAPALLWLFATLGPGFVPFVLWLLVGAGWVVALAWLRRRGVLGERGMVALVWIGLHAWIAPLWWRATWAFVYGWPPGSHLAPLHAAGFAYVMLRLIAWGVDWAREPTGRMRWRDTVAWLLYPPGLRFGPMLFREQFIERFNAWRPDAPPPWRDIINHGVSAVGGLLLLVGVLVTLPARGDGVDFFSQPDAYTTAELLRVCYGVPLTVYLFLWAYHRIALAMGLWVGIAMPPNFNNLPAASSPRDIWRRWNITVGEFIRRYIYIPLGGNRKSGLYVFSAAFVWCGVWHGYAPSFVVWPFIHVFALTGQRWYDEWRVRRGLTEDTPSGPMLLLQRFLTLHLMGLTCLVFSDFETCAVPLLSTLIGRLF